MPIPQCPFYSIFTMPITCNLQGFFQQHIYVYIYISYVILPYQSLEYRSYILCRRLASYRLQEKYVHNSHGRPYNYFKGAYMHATHTNNIKQPQSVYLRVSMLFYAYTLFCSHFLVGRFSIYFIWYTVYMVELGGPAIAMNPKKISIFLITY